MTTSATPTLSAVPIISLERADPKEVDRALREVGFLVITDHGVDEALIEGMWTATAAWFSRADAEKARAPLMAPDYPYGYSPLRSELHPGAEDDARAREPDAPPPSVADEKEMWCIGPVNDDAPARRWPAGAEGMQRAQEAYFHAMESLSDRLLQLMALALGLEDRDYFLRFNRKHASALRAINYPAVRGGLAPGQLRASAHTDYGALTILRSGGPGLEIFTRGGEWAAVPEVEESSFVINLGDLMSRWTHDRWHSTPHRVVVPPSVAGSVEDGAALFPARQAVAYFHNMDMDARIETVPTCVPRPPEKSKYEPIRAGEHLMRKHEAATRGERLNIYASAGAGALA